MHHLMSQSKYSKFQNLYKNSTVMQADNAKSLDHVSRNGACDSPGPKACDKVERKAME